MIYIWNNNYEEAEKTFLKVLTFKKKREVHYFYLAVAQERLGKYKKAIVSLENALKKKPESSRAMNFLGYLYADMNIKLDESLQLINKALNYEPENGAYLDSLGWVYYRLGKFELALSTLIKAEKIIVKDTVDPVVYDHIGDTYKKMKNINLAVKFWNKSIKFEKNNKNIKRISKKIKDEEVK